MSNDGSSVIRNVSSDIQNISSDIQHAETVVGIVSRLWNPVAQRVAYVFNLGQNVDSLTEAKDQLKCVRDNVKKRVDVAERRPLKGKSRVQSWLERGDNIEGQVNEMETEFQQMAICFENCHPNCCSGYALGKRVAEKLEEVNKLISESDSFNELPDAVEKKPIGLTVGMEQMLKDALSSIRARQVGVFGIYGIGGVGKTTLLKMINNSFVEGDHEFEVVIWVEVPKDLVEGLNKMKRDVGVRDLEVLNKFQRDIGVRLGLSWPENESKQKRTKDIYSILSTKKFMLLLDNLSGRLDLDEVGIPHPSRENKSKIAFTTRDEKVCSDMVAKKKKVGYLQEQEAMDLFRQNFGEVLNDDPKAMDLFQKNADSVVEKCRGLPLLLITIGRALANRMTPEQWRYVISVLSSRNPLSDIEGMNDAIFDLLKVSYDIIDDKTTRSCFLYCSLFPEGYSILKEKLIDYWIGEGFLDAWEGDLDIARYKGHDIIGRLKAVCLLESGSDEKTQVKMHDVIRGLALWIASEYGKKRNRFLVETGVELENAPKVERWKDAVRVSLMNHQIEKLTETPQCPNLLTLMLQSDRCENFHPDFFQSMPLLRVLDLSRAYKLTDLPTGIGNLLELRYLNLSHTGITSLPQEIGKLVNLRQLKLNSTLSLCTIPQGAISSLSQLRVMNLFDSYSNWEEVRGFNMSELEGLTHLVRLKITVTTVCSLQRLLGSSKLQNVTRNLCLRRAEEVINSTELSFLFKVMRRLKRLTINLCSKLEEVAIGADGEREVHYPDSSLECLDCLRLMDLNCIRVGSGRFKNLRRIYINRCPALKRIICLLQLECLETIEIDSCYVVEEVIGVAAAGDEVGDKELKHLKAIKLRSLPELTSFYALPFPSLQVLEVFNCPKLKKLTLKSAQKSIREIRGKKEWWDNLVGEEASIKSDFLPFFKEVEEEGMLR